jgi:hypothetical protein
MKVPTHPNQLFEVGVSHVVIEDFFLLHSSHGPHHHAKWIEGIPQCLHNLTIHLPNPFHEIETVPPKARLDMDSKVEFANCNQPFLMLQYFQRVAKLDPLQEIFHPLAKDVVNEENV